MSEDIKDNESEKNSEHKEKDNEKSIRKDNSHIEAGAIIRSLNLAGLDINPVISQSIKILLTAKKLSEGVECFGEDITAFKNEFVNDILSISAKLSTLSKYDEQDITRFRYCLCVFIDEMVMRNTSFIGSSYASDSLSIRFFKEASGGNKFFGIMDKWLENPAKHKDMLEFIYVCLILGYKGKFLFDDDCDKKLHLLMENIASAIAPTLNTNEEKAFELAYADNIKENFWSKYSYTLKKSTFIVIPVVIIFLFYIGNYFMIYKNNLEVSTYLSNKLEKDMNK